MSEPIYEITHTIIQSDSEAFLQELSTSLEKLMGEYKDDGEIASSVQLIDLTMSTIVATPPAFRKGPDAVYMIPTKFIFAQFEMTDTHHLTHHIDPTIPVDTTHWVPRYMIPAHCDLWSRCDYYRPSVMCTIDPTQRDIYHIRTILHKRKEISQ